MELFAVEDELGTEGGEAVWIFWRALVALKGIRPASPGVTGLSVGVSCSCGPGRGSSALLLESNGGHADRSEGLMLPICFGK